MSKFDKIFRRKKMMRNPEYCRGIIFVGFQKDDSGEFVLDKGEKIPQFRRCTRRLRPRKLKNVIRWECTDNSCKHFRYIKREKSTNIKVTL